VRAILDELQLGLDYDAKPKIIDSICARAIEAANNLIVNASRGWYLYMHIANSRIFYA
jgi:hypothetical protein